MNENKKIFVTQATLPQYENYCKKIKKIWDNHWLTNNGELHNELEQRIQKYLNAKNITLYTNGHLALENAIQSLNLKGEVITTPFTFISTTHAIARNGLTPVFCDINPLTKLPPQQV
jgi:dTDP-4-amino-4,6-dideoxygalactose transaminase